MNAVDAAIIRSIRHEMSKRAMETTRIDVQVVNGRVTLAGTAIRKRDQPTIDLKSEMDHLVKMITREREVKEVFMNVRLLEGHEEKKEDTGTRGRMRH